MHIIISFKSKTSDITEKLKKAHAPKARFLSICFHTQDKPNIASWSYLATKAWSDATNQMPVMVYAEVVVSAQEQITFRTLGAHDPD